MAGAMSMDMSSLNGHDRQGRSVSRAQPAYAEAD
jgi:hypothetical protein